MSLKVIELNDAALKVGDESGIIMQSPGFALAQSKNLQLGEVAEQQARLQPTLSYNKFWHQLSLDPVSHGNGIRHYADLAYAHLQHLADAAEIDSDVIFAVPGNFTKQQLAILLGLAKQCPFTPIGVVDSALAAVIADAGDQTIVYADIQLHQVLLTRMVISGQQMKIESVVQVPGVGSQNFIDLTMQLATRAFIQQCRFNPQHNADSEQQLYNALPHWWRQDDKSESSLVLELKANDTVHTVKLPRESVIASLESHYQKINQQISALASGTNSRVIVSAALASLPGVQTSLGNSHEVYVLGKDAVNKGCIDYREHICSPAAGMRLVTNLPLAVGVSNSTSAESLASSQANAQITERPTHALFRNRAIPLQQIEIRNNLRLNGHAPANAIQLAIEGLPDYPGRIVVAGNEVFLDSGKLEFLLNQKKVSGKHKLTLGDCIKFAENSEEISLIVVTSSA